MVGNNYAGRELVREVLGRPELRLVPHIGYVSLFPVMLRIIPPVSAWGLAFQFCLYIYLQHYGPKELLFFLFLVIFYFILSSLLVTVTSYAGISDPTTAA